jgi:glycosyltransferase involved in cell wall biosynthesis
MPAYSVVIPTYNFGGFIAAAIDSVLAQTERDLEIIVVDDGSTDDTEARLAPYRDRIRYFRQSNAGPSVARNRGILHAEAPLIAFLDADDLWRPTKLARQAAYLKQHTDTVLCYTDFTRGHAPGATNESRLQLYEYKGSGDAFHSLLLENFIHTSSVLVRREALARAGLFAANLRGAEALELWMRLARVGPFGFLDEVLIDVRRHETNTTNSVEFARHRVRATRLMMARWNNDPEAMRVMQQNLGVRCWDLAYAEQINGNYQEARAAYWQSACQGNRRVGALARAAFMSLPRGLVDKVLHSKHGPR